MMGNLGSDDGSSGRFGNEVILFHGFQGCQVSMFDPKEKESGGINSKDVMPTTLRTRNTCTSTSKKNPASNINDRSDRLGSEVIGPFPTYQVPAVGDSGNCSSGLFHDEVISFDGFRIANPYERGINGVGSKSVMPTKQTSTSTSTCKKNTASRRVGRRGDPRMNNAVKARLVNPHMTLLDALLAGGFSFPNVGTPDSSDRTIFDKDNVSLCQRKNQLIRRLRMFKAEKPPKKSSHSSSTFFCDMGGTSSLDEANLPLKTETTSTQHGTRNISALEHSTDASTDASSAAFALEQQLQGKCINTRNLLQFANIPAYVQGTPESRQNTLAASSALLDPSQGRNIFHNGAGLGTTNNVAPPNSAFSERIINFPFPHMNDARIQPEMVPPKDQWHTASVKQSSTCRDLMSTTQKAKLTEPSTTPVADQGINMEQSIDEFVKFLSQSMKERERV